MLWFSNNLQKQIKFMNRGSTVYKFQESFKSFSICWGSPSGRSALNKETWTALWESIQHAGREEYLLLPNLAAPVYTPFIQVSYERGTKTRRSSSG